MLTLLNNQNPQTSENTRKNPTAEKSSQLDPSGLNEKQRAAVELLAMGKSFKITAKQVNIDPRTLFTWRQDELFQAALRQRHRELWGDVSDRLRMLVDPSLEVLVEHLNDNYDRSRFRAASTILRLANLKRAARDEDGALNSD